MLMRSVFQRSLELHNGEWNKTAQGSKEVRGKKLGIVGYGNIGKQLSVLAEAMGMRVYYYDIEDRLANVVEVCESDYLNKIRHLATESSLISTPTKLILKTYRKLEQEAHLYGYESD